MWHLTCDTWHVTPYTWHVTHNIWHVTNGGGEHSLKISAPKRLPFGCNYVLNLEEKDDWINEWTNDNGVCKTVPATPGLLKKRPSVAGAVLQLPPLLINSFGRWSLRQKSRRQKLRSRQKSRRGQKKGDKNQEGDNNQEGDKNQESRRLQKSRRQKQRRRQKSGRQKSRRKNRWRQKPVRRQK